MRVPDAATASATGTGPWTVPLFVLLTLSLLVAGCGGASSSLAYPNPIPTGWHNAAVPGNEPLASYAISPDVAGLALACVGAPVNNLENSPLGPGTLWRTQDGGASWQELSSQGILPNCQLVAPPGGNGLLFAAGLFHNGPAVSVSTDAGSHWTGLNSTLTFDTPVGFVLAESILRAGVLYAPELPTASGLQPVMAMSRDDGQTWQATESTPDPLTRTGDIPLSIAADYSAPNAWFRILGQNGIRNSQRISAQPVLEHSSDGGRTWQIWQHLGPSGSYDWLGSALLATTPAQPERVCASFFPQVFPESTTEVEAVGLASGREAPAAEPHPGVPPRPVVIELAASSTGGQTWASTAVVQRVGYDSAVPPGVVMDQQGDCFLGDNRDEVGDPSENVLTLWKLAAGSAIPRVLIRFPGMTADFVGVEPGMQGSPERLAVSGHLGLDIVVTCGAGPCRLPWMPAPRLLWTPDTGA